MVKKNINGAALAGGKGNNKRVDNDYYATPSYAVKMLLNKLEQDGIFLNGTLIEPACGGGHISDVLIDKYGYSNVYSYDIVDRGYANINGIKNFITDIFPMFNNVITNPPFKHAEEFIRKALSIATDKIIMLCKIQLLEGVKRLELFKHTPLKYVYIHSSRVATYRNGESRDSNGKKWATTMCLAWFIWEQGYNGEPIIRWL